MNAFISGFGLGLSLILAIGAQNAFVLKQGIKKEYVFIVCLICAVSDAVLIMAGVFGLGYLVQKFTHLQDVARYGGAAFLFIYGLKSFYTAYIMSHELKPQEHKAPSLSKIMTLTLAFTWLNPHVYLDTVLLLGSVSTKFGELSLIFGFGAMCASFTFFFSLGYGARLLAPLFSKTISWKVLEIIVGFVMVALAISLLL
ncbi:amino acid transporter [Campylobacter sp. faydin G-24]|uniref:Amino acid transporter n=1 Tax=Campylobacter anatolicus TaxID=2829105 RepID=A0ABS5HKE1_9BACT|nr:LysE/ArgO family amino acid transporter [Campylobacter anatolicus]MBR8462736.1 amino acid transporter [Campylobacter anatolicus]MBR8464097.1 amino acid transporter [Campylobacter anatolicus]